MKKQTPALEIPAAIQKADIATLAAKYGVVNRATFEGFPPRTLVYRTFAGQLNRESGLYEGSHLFDEAPEDTDAEAVSFNQIFNSEA